MTLIDNIRECAAEANKLLLAQSSSIDAPFLYSYPYSCCDIISTHLSFILKYKYDVRIAKAYNKNNDEWHYWLEMEGLVLDLTAHQFPQYNAPLICLIPSPLERQFKDVERVLPCDAEAKANFPINHQLLDLLRVFVV